MRYISSFSGGLSSAVATERAITCYGREDVLVWFADTRWEDEDLYRFRDDCLKRWQCQYTEFAEGRTPLEVSRAQHVIPNNTLAPCTFRLKIEPFTIFLRDYPKPVTVLLGLNWDEQHRMKTPKERYGAIEGVAVDFPLLWKPIEYRPYYQVVKHDWGIEPPRLYKMGFSHNNCFSGDTRFITAEGIKTLGETVNQEVDVLGYNGSWKHATVLSFGKQNLWNLRVHRYSDEKVISTTPDHRWFKRHSRTGRDEILTRDLKSGDYLASIYGGLDPSVRLSAFGIAHGIVFGDGTYPRTAPVRNPATIVLCGEKNAELLKWFPLSPVLPVPNIGIRVSDLPRFWKELPPLAESKSYLYGWLTGYFASDGSVTSGQIKLSSSNYQNLEHARTIATYLSIGTLPIRDYMRTGLGTEPTPLYQLSFIPGTLREDFFLLLSHRERFLATTHNRPVDWQVVNIEPTDRYEEVFCAVVPNGHVFTLEDNILTGNCAGRCVKQGQGDWKKLKINFPERFVECRDWEREMRENPTNARYAFLKAVRGGVTVPLPLEELEKTWIDISEDNRLPNMSDDHFACYCSF